MHALVMYVWLLYWEMISSSLHIWSYSDYFAAILVFWHLKTNLKLFQLQKLLKVLMRPTPISIYLKSATKAYPTSPPIVLWGKMDWTMPYISWKLNCEYIWNVELKAGLFQIIFCTVGALPCYNKFLILKVFSTLGATFELCGREIWWLSIFLLKSCLR